MATGDVLVAQGALAQFTITMDALASDVASPYAGRTATFIDNTTAKYPAARVMVGIRSHTAAPTAGSVVSCFLMRRTGSTSFYFADDKFGGSADAANSITNSPLLGTIVIDVATANFQWVGSFDTSLLGPLGPEWSIGIVNGSGQQLHAATSLTGATNANPVVCSAAAATGFAVGDLVYVTGCVGNTAPNDKVWRLSAVSDANPYTFTLEGCVGNGEWSSAGTASGNFAVYQPYYYQVSA